MILPTPAPKAHIQFQACFRTKLHPFRFRAELLSFITAKWNGPARVYPPVSSDGQHIKEIAMQVNNKILGSLLLGIAISLPQYALADTFCSVTPDGKIHADDCAYKSYDECKHAIGSKGDCIVAQKDSSEAPYCVVTWSTACIHHDYKSCREYAESHVGFCYKNPDYKGPEK